MKRTSETQQEIVRGLTGAHVIASSRAIVSARCFGSPLDISANALVVHSY